MGLELLDLIFRLERRLGIKLCRDKIFVATPKKRDPPDLTIGELFGLVLNQANDAGALDLELDAEGFWPTFRRDVADALGIDEDEVTKDKFLIRDLGAG